MKLKGSTMTGKSETVWKTFINNIKKLISKEGYKNTQTIKKKSIKSPGRAKLFYSIHGKFVFFNCRSSSTCKNYAYLLPHLPALNYKVHFYHLNRGVVQHLRTIYYLNLFFFTFQGSRWFLVMSLIYMFQLNSFELFSENLCRYCLTHFSCIFCWSFFYIP